MSSTSTRRGYLHLAIAPEFLACLRTLYASPALQVGDPLDARTLLGLLHSRGALDIFDGAIMELNAAGAQIIFGGSSNSVSSGWYQDLMSPLGGIIISLYGCISPLPVSGAIFSNFPFIGCFVFA
jgi:aldehyde dehydrogenase family 7 protein A1